MQSLITIGVILLFLFSLGMCDSSSGPDAAELRKAAKSNIASLRQSLDGGALPNAALLKTYADTLARKKPDLAEPAAVLKKEATPQGALFTDLEKRLKDADALSDEKKQKAEFAALIQASDSAVFNDALLDPVNTLAGLSGGTLTPVNAPGGGAAPAGSALVGNPAYGQWQQSPSGGSFWVWYGQYRLISDLLGGGSPFSYDRWSSRRGWSYYHDADAGGASPAARERAAKQAGAKVESARRASSYGGKRRENKAFTASSPRRSSSYGGASTSRNSGTRNTRSYSGGTRRSSNYGFGGSFRGSSRSRGGFGFGGK